MITVDNTLEAGHQAISIEIGYSRTVNYAAQQNDIPIINSLRIINTSGEAVSELRLSIRVEPDFAKPVEMQIASIGPEESYNLGEIDLVLSHNFLRELTERVSGLLIVEIFSQNGLLSSCTEKIALLAYDEWSANLGPPELLAAFVLPNHPAVERILSRAADKLRDMESDALLSGYQSKSAQRSFQQTSAIYGALQECGLRYINPPSSFETGNGQKIRTPDRILENRLGTCIDLATLAAACLEQAGLNPLICLFSGHAFVGVWLEQQTFPDCATDDLLRLRKRIDLGEVCVFETIMLTSDEPKNIDAAINHAANRVASAIDFRYVLDIERCRISLVKPLPLRGASTTEDAPARASTLANTGSPAPDKVVNPETPNRDINLPESPVLRLDRWKRKLLDLTMNNRLLNFRSTKKTLPLLTHDLSALTSAFAAGNTYSILAKPSEFDDSGQRSAEIHRLRTGTAEIGERLKGELQYGRLHTSLPEVETGRRLPEIYRDARNSMEESGANTLYLAVGFLSWFESASSQKEHLAPIIMIPMEIERRSVQEGFTIKQGDESPMVNATLLELLHNDFELSVPGVDGPLNTENGIDVQAVFNAFRQAVKLIDRWEVQEAATIGLFSFTKFLMWRDLEMRTDELRKNKIVTHLINTPGEAFYNSTPNIKPEQLDEEFKPIDVYCPMECDASQLAAICSASAGNSFVLHGPPGTGKSQSITNIIANCLAQGKTVLFVSEKMAALSVVHRRLTECGLGPFCLELHSDKGRKKDVIDQLGQSLDFAASHSADDFGNVAERVFTLRRELNVYVEAIHSKRDIGESFHQGLSRLIALERVGKIALDWPPDTAVDRRKLEHLRDVVDQLKTAAVAIEPISGNVWRAAACDDWNPTLQSSLLKTIESLRETIAELQRTISILSPVVGITGAAWSELELRSVIKLAECFLSSPSTPRALIVSPEWPNLNLCLNDWIAHGLRRDQLRTKLLCDYEVKVLDLDIDSLQAKISASEASWFVTRYFARQAVKRSLSTACRRGRRVEISKMQDDLDLASALRAEQRLLDKYNDTARECLGTLWRDGEAEWDQLAKLRDATIALRKVASEVAGSDLERAGALLQLWSSVMNERYEELNAQDGLGGHLREFISKSKQLFAGCDLIERTLSLGSSQKLTGSNSAEYLNELDSTLKAWSENISELKTWCYWRASRSSALRSGLKCIVQAFETGSVCSRDFKSAFERAFYQWWTDRIISADESIRKFYSREFERRIENFRHSDLTYIELTKGAIAAKLAAQIPRSDTNANRNSEMGIVQRERQKQRSHIPIRQLVQKIPNLLSKLKPCLLMSPMSVAQYLDPSFPQFDLVVFDEASQMPVWDAIGAIARGKEAVIVGDPKQLPPTNFFSRNESGFDDVEDEVVEDLESILDECLAVQIPSMRLEWHYRSQSEGLIAFSNYHYYDNNLLTFPSPSQDLGISHRAVSGFYDKSKSRTNRAEADAVVAEVVRRLGDGGESQQSIGVVTFSMAQQRLVEDLLDEERRKNPAIEPYFHNESSPHHEPVFIKNLENVQGDERDVILFSICYGPDAEGRVSMNMGPLNRIGGERRLNVAITRARQNVIVFSTLLPEHIDLSKTRASGVSDLKNFLEFARIGKAALTQKNSIDPSAESESIFEEHVCAALRDRGHTVHLQVGCSGYRIDMAIVDPNQSGRYLLGIECDGAMYHRAKTARDRDRLRAAVLTGLGWKLHRVWSTDWWERPGDEIGRIESALEEAKRGFKRTDVSVRSGNADATVPLRATTPMPSLVPSVAPARISPALPKFVPYDPNKILGTISDFYGYEAETHIKRIFQVVTEAEGPLSTERLFRIVANHYGLSKVGQRMQERLQILLTNCDLETSTRAGRTFVWPKMMRRSDYKTFRIPDPDVNSTRRDIEHIADEEIANASFYVLKSQISLPKADLVSEVARLFGFSRNGPVVRECIESGIEVLIKRGDATNRNGSVSLSDDRN